MKVTKIQHIYETSKNKIKPNKNDVRNSDKKFIERK